MGLYLPQHLPQLKEYHTAGTHSARYIISPINLKESRLSAHLNSGMAYTKNSNKALEGSLP
jgi:hypothetical protein